MSTSVRRKTEDSSFVSKGDSRKVVKVSSRRHLRKRYRSLLSKTEALGVCDTMETLCIADKADDLFREVKHPREASLDSTLLSSVAVVGKKQVQSLQTDFVSFDGELFCEMLAKCFTTSTDQVVQRASSIFMRTYPCKLMTSYFLLELGKRKRSRTADKGESETKPKIAKLLTASEQDEDEPTSKIVYNTYNRLRDVCSVKPGVGCGNVDKSSLTSVPLLSFSSDPSSFSATVRNVFNLSFLVKVSSPR